MTKSEIAKAGVDDAAKKFAEAYRDRFRFVPELKRFVTQAGDQWFLFHAVKVEALWVEHLRTLAHEAAQGGDPKQRKLVHRQCSARYQSSVISRVRKHCAIGLSELGARVTRDYAWAP